MRQSLLAVTVLALAVGGSAACATKKYVNTQVGQVSGKVDTLSTALEQTQERTRQNEAKITDVDTRAQGAAKAAHSAADSAASAANTADGKAVKAGEAARMASEKADAVDRATKKIVYEVVLSEDSGNFKFGQWMLPDESKTEIDQLINQIKADPKGAFFEIEGHTDNVGDKATNERIGLQRAEAVKRYLYETHQIPLHKMNVISYGEEKPATDNKTRDGRAQNRRVVIRVLG